MPNLSILKLPTFCLKFQTRKRLADALQNRDLMAAVGEYENFLPLDTRPVRELRAMIECLSGEGSFLGPAHRRPAIPPSPELSKNKLVRTEKVGSGAYSNLTKVSTCLRAVLFPTDYSMFAHYSFIANGASPSFLISIFLTPILQSLFFFLLAFL